MPFTPSHVAAVLPFARTPLLPSALVIGSIAPDLFFYVPLPISRNFTHSWLGVVTVDLVFGILAFVLWQVAFRTPLVDYAPLSARQRIATIPWFGIRSPRLSWPRWAILLIASVLLGTITHIVWDSFTHPDWVTYQLPWLLTRWGFLPVYEWGQYGGSAVGAGVLVVWAIAWWRRTPRASAAPSRISRRVRYLFWVTTLGAGLLVAVIMWIPGAILRSVSLLSSALLFQTVTSGIAAAGLTAAVWIALWWALFPKVGPSPKTQPAEPSSN